MDLRIAITSPVPATPTKDFLKSFPDGYDWIVIDDSNGKLDLPKRDNIFVYDYRKQKDVLGKFYDEYTSFHKSASCRNLAHFLAYKQGYDLIFSLDYDCVMPKNFISDHLEPFHKDKLVSLKTKSGWVNPIESHHWFTRGFPYSARDSREQAIVGKTSQKVVLNMGLWENVVDINAIDKVLEPAPKKFPLMRSHTAVNGFIPLCGMNNSFVREIVPAYFFLPNFKLDGWEVSRHDDIWGGYILQKLIRKKGDVITYGSPTVFHERESFQPRVLHHEHYMHILEPYFYGLVDEAASSIRKGKYIDMFSDFSENFARLIRKNTLHIPEKYLGGFKHQSKYITLWKKIFQKL